MNQKVFRGAFFICALLLFCIGCAAAPPVTTYSSVIIDTYDAADGSSAAGNANHIELWNSDCTTLLASNDGFTDEFSRSPNNQYAIINYTTGLVSGDYWVLIRAHSDGDTFGYAIRVLTTLSNYSGWTFGSFLTSEPSSDAPTAGMMGIPTKYQTITLTNTTSDRLNRFILPSGVNWVKVHLP